MASAVARVRLVKWGNSQAVRLPRAVLQQARLQEGAELIVRVKVGQIALETEREEITLKKLLAGITPRNLHKEQDWGQPVGNEVW